MKLKRTLIQIGLAAGVTVLIAGCANPPLSISERQDQTLGSMDETTAGYDTFGRRWGVEAPAKPAPAKPAPAKPAPAQPAPAPAPMKAQVSCSSEITSGIVHLAKKAPAEAQMGQEYMTELDASAVACAQNVVIIDHVPAGATYVRSEPAAQVDGDKLTWNMADMNAGAVRTIKVWLRADREGTLTSCATIKADPRVCSDTLVVKADIRLTKTEPGEVTVCDPIPVTLVVRNTGTTRLTGVKVSDNLPVGLTSDGKTSLVFDAGDLAPTESREFKFNAMASRTGQFVNKASASSAEGVKADASATTTVREPVLTVACAAPDQRYMGRPFDVAFTVVNKGDTAAAGTV
jgi:uncharacterized repeat protein (TIGR01451 family)